MSASRRRSKLQEAAAAAAAAEVENTWMDFVFKKGGGTDLSEKEQRKSKLSCSLLFYWISAFLKNKIKKGNTKLFILSSHQSEWPLPLFFTPLPKGDAYY